MMQEAASTSRREDPVPSHKVHRGILGVLSSYRTEIAIAIAIILIEIIVGVLVPSALTWGNLADIAQAAAPLIMMSFGVLLVVITGGIDLSVGSVFSLAGMITGLALAHNYGGISSTIAGLIVGLVVGAINGALVTFVGLAPFVVTLITYAVAGSLAFIVTQGHSLAVSNPDYYLLNGGTLVPGIPNFILYCLVLLVAEEFVLRRVVLGRWIYGVGSSSNAARLLGIPVRGIRLSVYIVSGLLASFASILDVSYISNAEATAGSAMMLQSIAEVVIGGASLFGGTGSAVGALLGALMITVIQNGVNLIGINSFWQGSVTGLVILVAVLVDRITKAKR